MGRMGIFKDIIQTRALQLLFCLATTFIVDAINSSNRNKLRVSPLLWKISNGYTSFDTRLAIMESLNGKRGNHSPRA